MATVYEPPEAPPPATVTQIHPNKFIRAAATLYKRRGKLTATVRSEWVERLFVLTDTALFWYDLGGGPMDRMPKSTQQELFGTQQGRVEARHVVSIKEVELQGAPAAQGAGRGLRAGCAHSGGPHAHKPPPVRAR